MAGDFRESALRTRRRLGGPSRACRIGRKVAQGVNRVSWADDDCVLSRSYASVIDHRARQVACPLHRPSRCGPYRQIGRLHPIGRTLERPERLDHVGLSRRTARSRPWWRLSIQPAQPRLHIMRNGKLRPAGLEPATPGLGNRCSILLSYERQAK